MNIYIIDASVILRWFDREARATQHKLNEILNEQENHAASLHSTSFIILEVANGLRYSYKNDIDIEDYLNKFIDLPITLHQVDSSHMRQITKLALKLHTTVYDTSYHFLAHLMGGTFFTCDAEYYKKAHSLGSIELL